MEPTAEETNPNNRKCPMKSIKVVTRPGMAHLTYKERLKSLKLPTLQYRRYRGDMIEMYKLTHGHYDEDAINGFVEIRSDGSHNIRKRRYAVANEKWKSNLKKNAFRCRVAD